MAKWPCDIVKVCGFELDILVWYSYFNDGICSLLVFGILIKFLMIIDKLIL